MNEWYMCHPMMNTEDWMTISRRTVINLVNDTSRKFNVFTSRIEQRKLLVIRLFQVVGPLPTVPTLVTGETMPIEIDSDVSQIDIDITFSSTDPTYPRRYYSKTFYPGEQDETIEVRVSDFILR